PGSETAHGEHSAHRLGGHTGGARERHRERRLVVEARAALVEIADDDAATERAPAGGERNLAEERAEERRLPGAVRPRHHEPVAVAEDEVERPEAEGSSLDDGAFEPDDDVAAPARRRELELKSPRPERPVDPPEP